MTVAPGYRRRSAGTYGVFTAGSPKDRDKGSLAAPGGVPVSVGPWGLVSGPGEVLLDGSARLLETTTYRSMVNLGVPPKVTASHEDPSRPAAGLATGNGWLTPPDPTGEVWVCFTFNVPRQACRVTLRQDAHRGFPGAPRTWRIQGSKDGKAWADVVQRDSGDALHNNGADVTVDFPPVKFAKWRLLVDAFTGSAVSLASLDLFDIAGYEVSSGPAVFDTADLPLITVSGITYCSPIRERHTGDRLRWSASVDGGATWVIADVSAEDFADLVPPLDGDRVRFRVTIERAALNERSPVAGPVNLGLNFQEVTEVSCDAPIPLLGVTLFEFTALTPDEAVRVQWDGGRLVIWRDPRWVSAPVDDPGFNLGEDLAGLLRIPEGAKLLTITAPAGAVVLLRR